MAAPVSIKFRWPAVLLAAALPLALPACKSANDLEAMLKVTRSSCPAVALPAYTNEVTLFDPANSRDASAIDVVAVIDDLKSTCTEGAETIASTADFEVAARRTNTAGARDVVLPYYATVIRGGRSVVSKSLSRVVLHFADGEARAVTRGQASAGVALAAATLPDDTLKQINRRRKPGDPDAALDPMADPKVKAAVQAASFEFLIGFQLSDDQLKYNATR
jgi:hypothetical protein